MTLWIREPLVSNILAIVLHLQSGQTRTPMLFYINNVFATNSYRRYNMSPKVFDEAEKKKIRAWNTDFSAAFFRIPYLARAGGSQFVGTAILTFSCSTNGDR